MKKSLLTLAVATICLSGCGKNEDGLKSKKIDGKEVIAMVGDTPIYADDIADKILYNAEGAELIYSELTKLVTKLAYPAAEDIKASAEVQLSQWKDEVKTTASTNGTTYEEENLGHHPACDCRAGPSGRHRQRLPCIDGACVTCGLFGPSRNMRLLWLEADQ